MAYELTGAAASTGNPYAIVGAAIIDTIRAAAKQTTTESGRGLSQNQLKAQDFSSYVTNAISMMNGQGGAGIGSDQASKIFTDQLIKASAGKYAAITAPTVSYDQSSTTTKRSIICTTLADLGEIHPVVYWAGIPHWESRNPRMISGYHKWGYYVADLCKKNISVRRVCGFIARSRYLYVVFGQWNFVGWLTVKIGEPVCKLIGDKDGIN